MGEEIPAQGSDSAISWGVVTGEVSQDIDGAGGVVEGDLVTCPDPDDDQVGDGLALNFGDILQRAGTPGTRSPGRNPAGAPGTLAVRSLSDTLQL